MISIVPDDASPRRRAQCIDRWCAALPAMVGLEAAWVASKTPQRLFDAVCQAPNLEVLQMKWTGIKSLEALRSDGPLRQLDLGLSTSIESIEPLAAMRGLDQLRVENLQRVASLEPLSALTRLTGLAYEGGLDSRSPRG